MSDNYSSSTGKAINSHALFVEDILSNITRYLPSHVACRLFLIGNRALIYQLEHGGITEVTHFIRGDWRLPQVHGDIFPRFLLSRLNASTNTRINEEHLERFTVITLPTVFHSLPQLPFDHLSTDPSQLLHLPLTDPYLDSYSSFDISDDDNICKKLRCHAGACKTKNSESCYMADLWRLLPRSKLQSLSITLPDLYNGYYLVPVLFEHFESDNWVMKFPSSPVNSQAASLAPPSSSNTTSLSPTHAGDLSIIPRLDAPVLPFPKLVFLKLHGSNEEREFVSAILAKLVVPKSLTRLEYNEPERRAFVDDDEFNPAPYLPGLSSNGPWVPSSDHPYYTLLDSRITFDISGDRFPDSWRMPVLAVPGQVWSPHLTDLKLMMKEISKDTVMALPRSLTRLSLEATFSVDSYLTVASHEESYYPHSLTFLCITLGASVKDTFANDPSWALSLPPKLKSLWLNSHARYTSHKVHSESMLYMPPSLEHFWAFRFDFRMSAINPTSMSYDRLNSGALSHIRSLRLNNITEESLIHLTSIECLSVDFAIQAVQPRSWLPMKHLRFLQLGITDTNPTAYTLDAESAKALATLPLETLMVSNLDCNLSLLPRTLTALCFRRSESSLLQADGAFAGLPRGLTTLKITNCVLPVPSSSLLALPPGLVNLELGQVRLEDVEHLYALPPALRIINLGLSERKTKLNFNESHFWTLPSGLIRPLIFCFLTPAYCYEKGRHSLPRPSKTATSSPKL